MVKNVSDRVAVMYLGRLCEIAPSDLLYQAPAHHYTAALLASAVEPDPEATRTSVALAGEPPSPINPPSGCRFRTRCPRAEARCAEEVPEMRDAGTGTRGGLPLPHRQLTPSRSRRVALAAAARFPDLLEEGPLIIGALAEVGLEAETAVWNDPDVRWAEYDLVVANGAWDNIRHVDDFVRWTERLEREGVTVVNSPATLRWNLDKRYLRALEAAGVPVVPTSWVERPAPVDLVGEVVVKPAVSGGGHQTARYEAHEHDEGRRHIDDLVASGRVAMVQPLPSSRRRRGRGGPDLPRRASSATPSTRSR